MWGRIALFELRYQLRRPIAPVSFVIFFALGFAQASAVAFNTSGSGVANTPFNIVFAHTSFSIIAIFLSLATIADVALRDAATRMDAILRTKPVARAPYLAARFAGAFAVAVLSFSGATLGLLAANLMPWTPPGAVGPFAPMPYVFGLLAIAAVNVFSTSALFFTVAALTRSLLATYLSALALFILFVIADVALSASSHRWLGALADPFGQRALSFNNRYWSFEQRSTLLPSLDGVLLWNRLLWIALGAASLSVALALFDRVGGRRAGKVELAKAAASPLMRERPHLASTGAGMGDQLWARTRFEIRTLLRSWTFLVLLILSLSACLGLLAIGDQVQDGMLNLPVTYVVIDGVAAAFGLAAILVPIAYAGELVWRDRNVGIAAIIDASPTPTAVFILSKLAAIAASVVVLFVFVAAAGIGFQWFRGVSDINLSFYLIKMLAVLGLPALMFGVLALLVQTIVNQKYVGLLVVLAVLIAIPFASSVGVENKLFVLFDVPDVPLSDMNGYGHFLARTLWYDLYWGCIALLIGIGARLLWVRGTGSLWTRIKQSRQAMTPALATLTGVALAGAAASGGYIYWNTHVLNDFMTTADREREQVAYEKTYRPKALAPQPRIARMDVDIDLYPGARGFRSRGRYTLVNRNTTPIESVHVLVAAEKGAELTLEGAERVNAADASVFEFRVVTPFLPGEMRTLTFALSDTRPGFQDGAGDTAIVYNGSFAQGHALAPLIGVQSQYFLQSTARRRAHGLEPLPGMARANDPVQRRRNFFNADADFLTYAITVSTEGDQIALAPGNLERAWTEGGRKFFRYTTDTPVVNFWAVVSGRYEVARERWNGIDLVVYHDAKHAVNVPRMLDAMKAALGYYTENFGPFPHRQLRIAEFPRYASFAQSFPTLVPYSESVGFIADLRETQFDFVWHIVAHEVAHQWWGHQVVGANVEGAQFLSESLSEYSALMVAEKRYGPHKMRQFFRHEMDVYLSRRGGRNDEQPLATARMDQGYVHYQKGSLALYALKDTIGEAALNRALARLLAEHKFKSDPYPTSLDLIAILREQAGPEHHQLITDLFETITFWDLRVAESEAVEMPGGRWRVRLNVNARKLNAASDGRESEAALEQPIDIGLFDQDPGRPGFDEQHVIHLQKHAIKSGTQWLEITTDRKPAFVGVDPYGKLISRTTSLNVVPLAAAKP